MATKGNGHGQLNKKPRPRRNGRDTPWGGSKHIVDTTMFKPPPTPPRPSIQQQLARQSTSSSFGQSEARDTVRERCFVFLQNSAARHFHQRGDNVLERVLPLTDNWKVTEDVSTFVERATGRYAWDFILDQRNVTYGQILDWMVKTIKASPRGRAYFG